MSRPVPFSVLADALDDDDVLERHRREMLDDDNIGPEDEYDPDFILNVQGVW